MELAYGGQKPGYTEQQAIAALRSVINKPGFRWEWLDPGNVEDYKACGGGVLNHKPLRLILQKKWGRRVEWSEAQDYFGKALGMTPKTSESLEMYDGALTVSCAHGDMVGFETQDGGCNLTFKDCVLLVEHLEKTIKQVTGLSLIKSIGT